MTWHYFSCTTFVYNLQNFLIIQFLSLQIPSYSNSHKASCPPLVCVYLWQLAICLFCVSESGEHCALCSQREQDQALNSLKHLQYFLLMWAGERKSFVLYYYSGLERNSWIKHSNVLQLYCNIYAWQILHNYLSLNNLRSK